jgi:hypothetical protein
MARSSEVHGAVRSKKCLTAPTLLETGCFNSFGATAGTAVAQRQILETPSKLPVATVTQPCEALL